MNNESSPWGLAAQALAAPLDLDPDREIVLSWRLTASAQPHYQVQVAPYISGWGDNGVLEFESDEGSEHRLIVPGRTFPKGGRFKWRVRTCDSAARNWSPWSSESAFGTAPDGGWAMATPIWAPASSETQLTDYVVRASFTFPMRPNVKAVPDGLAAGIRFRARSGGDGYVCWLDPSLAEVRISLVSEGVESVLGQFPAPDLTVGDVHEVTVSAMGSALSVSLDGEAAGSVTNSSFLHGGIGLCGSSKGRFTVFELNLTDPNGDVLFHENYRNGSTSLACGSVRNDALEVAANSDSLWPAPNEWAFLRTEFMIPSGRQPIWATLFATASSAEPARQFVYKAWVNGQFAGLGPTRSVSDETRFDGFDVTALLTDGRNAIGLQAYTTREQRVQILLAVGFADGSILEVPSNATWQGLGGDGIYPNVGSIGTSFFSAPVENLCGPSFPYGFAKPGFSAEGWQPVDIRPVFKRLQPSTMAKVQLQNSLPVRLQEVEPHRYILDYGKTLVGGLRLGGEEWSGRAVLIRYGEVLGQDGAVKFQLATTNTYQDTWLMPETSALSETWGLRVFRYAEVLNAPRGLSPADFAAINHVYPEDFVGKQSSSNAVLDRIWELSRATLESSNGNLYVDSWTREREPYEADAYLQMRANFAVGSDTALAAYSLEYLMTRRTWPTEWPMYIVLAVHDYYMETGDLEFVSRHREVLAEKLPLQWLDPKTGLLGKDEGSDGSQGRPDCDIVDWPRSERDGYVFAYYNTVVNAIGYRSLICMATLESALGRAESAGRLSRIAARLRSAMNELLYDGNTGAYRDGLYQDLTPIDHHAVHATAFPLAWGVPEHTNYAQLAQHLLLRGMNCSVYAAPFFLEALAIAGGPEEVVGFITGQGIRGWKHMLDLGAGSTMEAWDESLKPNLTHSHPWAASPTFLVSEVLMGISPLAPGFSHFTVRPQCSGLERLHVERPTVRGTIKATWTPNEHRLEIDVPGGCSATVALPSNTANATIKSYAEQDLATPIEVGPGQYVVGIRNNRYFVTPVSSGQL